MKIHLLLSTALLSSLSYLVAVAQSDAAPRTPIQVPTVGMALFDFAPALEIPIDGSIWLRDEKLLDPNPGAEQRRHFRSWLSDFARQRGLGTRDLSGDAGAQCPSDLLLVRADVNAPFASVLTILEACELRDIQVTRVGFHVNQEVSVELGLQDYTIPGAVLADQWNLDWEYELHTVDAELSVRVPGTKRMVGKLDEPWDETPGTRFSYDPEERALDYAIEGLTVQSVHWADVQCLRIAEEVEQEDRDVIFRVSVGSGVTLGEVFEFWQRTQDSIIPYFRRSPE